METRKIIQNYYDAMAKKVGWENMVTDDITFKGTGMQFWKGKDVFVENTRKFLMIVKKSTVKKIIAEGTSACVLTNYLLALPTGDTLSSDVAEIVGVRNGKVSSFEIYFDTVAFNEFMAKMPKQ